MTEQTHQKCICEYVWIDAYGDMRSKIKVNYVKIDDGKPELLVGEWSFDGSSTGQASGTDSDVILKPVTIFKNPFITYQKFSFLVLCECYNKDRTPHITNTRSKCIETFTKCKEEEPVFGIEQEYVLFQRDGPDKGDGDNSPRSTDRPYGWKDASNPGIGGQGPYYCGVGGDRAFGRKISEKHLQLCLEAGIEICGTNAEVAASQWEYQIGPLPPLEVSDHLWMSRFILMRVTEEYDCYASFHPKPYKHIEGHGGWNGSGGHTNFSTIFMRNEGGLEHIIKACERLGKKHSEHMEVYGKHNEERLTGLHETSSIDRCTWGYSDRGKSIRIPLQVVENKRGYLEDRRPASNLDPYIVTEKIMHTTLL
jgi:glutamine synthetase